MDMGFVFLACAWTWSIIYCLRTIWNTPHQKFKLLSSKGYGISSAVYSNWPPMATLQYTTTVSCVHCMVEMFIVFGLLHVPLVMYSWIAVFWKCQCLLTIKFNTLSEKLINNFISTKTNRSATRADCLLQKCCLHWLCIVFELTSLQNWKKKLDIDVPNIYNIPYFEECEMLSVGCETLQIFCHRYKLES